MPAFLQPIIIPTTPASTQPSDQDGGSSAPVQSQQKSYPLNGVGSYTLNHGLSYIPRITVLLPSGEPVYPDVLFSPGQAFLTFPKPFTGTLLLE